MPRPWSTEVLGVVWRQLGALRCPSAFLGRGSPPFQNPENRNFTSLSVLGRGRLLPLELLNGPP